MSILDNLIGEPGKRNVLVGVLFNGAVAAAIATGLLTIYNSYFTAEHKLQSELINKLLEHDSANNKDVVSGFRTLNELGVLDRIDQRKWDAHIKSNHGSLPRFYYSGFVWSIFYPNVDDLKRAYKELGHYDGEIDGVADGAFVLATMRFQEAYCIKHQLMTDCKRYVDGVAGKNTIRELGLEMAANGKRLILD